jgi:NADH dehydrogenase FAD-containing subunit
MKTGQKLGIIGGGFAARSIARRLKYDFDITVLSKTLYHLENERRINNIFGGNLQEEDSLMKLDDLCKIKEGEAVKYMRSEDGSFEVVDSEGNIHKFDRLVLALGSHADKRNREFFHTYHEHEFTTYTTMQSMRMRYLRDTLCRGQLRIVTAGLQSKNLFNAISVTHSKLVSSLSS